MKKHQISLFFLLAVSALSYLYRPVSFLLLLVIVLCCLLLLATWLSRVAGKALSKRWQQVPLKIIAISAFGIVVGLLRPLEAAILPAGHAGAALAHAYKTDQTDRMTLKAYISVLNHNLAHRDQLRLAQVQQLYEKDQLETPIQKFHAAFIFHHSKRSSHYQVAHALAREAASAHELKNNFVVQWLAKASYDRWMVSLGKPQKYGTQDKFSLSLN